MSIIVLGIAFVIIVIIVITWVANDPKNKDK